MVGEEKKGIIGGRVKKLYAPVRLIHNMIGRYGRWI
jgi:hypothetical protein